MNKGLDDNDVCALFFFISRISFHLAEPDRDKKKLLGSAVHPCAPRSLPANTPVSIGRRDEKISLPLADRSRTSGVTFCRQGRITRTNSFEKYIFPEFFPASSVRRQTSLKRSWVGVEQRGLIHIRTALQRWTKFPQSGCSNAGYTITGSFGQHSTVTDIRRFQLVVVVLPELVASMAGRNCYYVKHGSVTAVSAVHWQRETCPQRWWLQRGKFCLIRYRLVSVKIRSGRFVHFTDGW